jgi:prophage regulatory protein
MPKNVSVPPDAATQFVTPAAKDRRTDSLWRIAMVAQRTGLSRATIYRLEAAGNFPSRQQISPRCVGWYGSDIEDFIANPKAFIQATKRRSARQ